MILSTDRLVLRKLITADLHAFQAYRTPELAKYQGWDVKTDAEALEFLAALPELWTLGSWHQLGMVRGEELIGDIGVFFDTSHVELGVTLSSRHQKCGYAREALSALIAWLWRTTDIAYIQAITLEENTASVHLLEHLGMTIHHTRPDEGELVYRVSR